MHRIFPLLVLLLAVLAPTGCISTRVPTDASSSPNTSRLDSLRTENTTLRARVRRLQDSLQAREDVETGQYYRDLRILKDRLNRLTYEVRALRDGGQTVTTLSANTLFEPGTATLTSAGAKRLQTVSTRLQTTYPDRTIRVEGHTDDVPLGDKLQERFASNWELSCARATTVVRHLIGHSNLDPAQFVALGFGTTDPIASNETARGRRRNRRVRIAVLPSPRDYSRPFETAW